MVWKRNTQTELGLHRISGLFWYPVSSQIAVYPVRKKSFKWKTKGKLNYNKTNTRETVWPRSLDTFYIMSKKLKLISNSILTIQYPAGYPAKKWISSQFSIRCNPKILHKVFGLTEPYCCQILQQSCQKSTPLQIVQT